MAAWCARRTCWRNLALNQFIGDFSYLFLRPMKVVSLSDTIPESLFILFQMTFAIITPALIAGAFADRMKFSAFLKFMGLWLIFFYCPIAHMVWGGGILSPWARWTMPAARWFI